MGDSGPEESYARIQGSSIHRFLKGAGVSQLYQTTRGIERKDTGGSVRDCGRVDEC